jgi:hypothetical protein
MQETIYGYAKHRKELGLSGGTRGAVQKAIKTGRITKGADGRIDVNRADRDWEKNLNQRKRHQSITPILTTKSSEAPSAATDETFLEAQRQHEWLKVQKEEMELRKRRGELLEKQEAEEKWSKLLTAFRNRMGIIPDNLAPRVAVLNDVLECRTLIEREVRQVLTALSEYQPDAA